MSCVGCRYVGAKLHGRYRCHGLPEGIGPGSAEQYFPIGYWSSEQPCPSFTPKSP